MEQILFTAKSPVHTVPIPNGKEAHMSYTEECGAAVLSVTVEYAGAFGMGERYNTLNQKGYNVVNRVEEHFCFQGEHTYCPAPFFWTDSGFGLYVDTDRETSFGFGEDSIRISMPIGVQVIIFTGAPAEMIRDYQALFGPAKLPPKWAFGPWISANRWKTQAEAEAQLDRLAAAGFPATVLVLEAWSDEATFYIWNGAKYTPIPGGAPLRYEDFDFSASQWPDPKGMVKKLHDRGLHLILWQVPVYKHLSPNEAPNEQHAMDCADAEARGLVVHNIDGTPYAITDGHWFAGSMIPDFTNPKTVKSWFDKRRYLLDMGVDGFKTDGGEFIYSPNVLFHDGTSGLEGKNRYAQSYTAAYTNFLGKDKVLFSRAGYAGAHTTPIHWAGDQQSQNSELKSALTAGLSAALTGIPFWSFDIAGFAGPLPSLDLYRRATQLACFCPVMQWHSEPDGGQFKELMPGGEGNNERSPWNMAEAYNEPAFATEMRFWHWLRTNLMPYLWNVAQDCAKSGRPMMRPLVYDWPEDPQAISCDDEFLLGDALLVAPLLEENDVSRSVYLPTGDWVGLFDRVHYDGGQSIAAGGDGKLPVFLRAGYGVALDLGGGQSFGEPLMRDQCGSLHFLLAGAAGTTSFRDDTNSVFTLSWQDGKVEVVGQASCPITWEFC